MFETVIAAIDPEVGARDVILAARAIAPDARLLLTTVYPYPTDPQIRRHGSHGSALRQDALEMLNAKRELAGIDAESFAIPGTSPAKALRALASEQQADLIVIGAARHGAVGRFVLGDVAHAILGGTPCPVLVAPRDLPDVPVAVGRVGLAYDGSPEAEHALLVAVTVTKQLGAQLEIVHAIDVGAVPESWGFQTPIYLDALRGPAQERLDAVVRALDVPTRGQVVMTGAHLALRDLAKSVDLVVCGSRGWGPAGRTAFGSTAERLMHHSGTPVLVVPRGSEEAAARINAPGASQRG